MAFGGEYSIFHPHGLNKAHEVAWLWCKFFLFPADFNQDSGNHTEVGPISNKQMHWIKHPSAEHNLSCKYIWHQVRLTLESAAEDVS